MLSDCLERGVVCVVWQCLDTPTVNVNGLLLGVETVRHLATHRHTRLQLVTRI